MKLYRVTTTFIGADGPSKFYFDSADKAEKFLAECQNGERETVEVTAESPLNYSDGCTMNDLTYGNFNAQETVIE